MDVDQYQLILDNAQVGWWKADFEERCYICSDYLISLLELDGPKISIVDFFLLIRGDYRDRIANEFAFFIRYWYIRTDLPYKDLLWL